MNLFFFFFNKVHSGQRLDVVLGVCARLQSEKLFSWCLIVLSWLFLACSGRFPLHFPAFLRS